MRFRVPSLLVAGLLSFASLPALNAQPPGDRSRKLTIKSFLEGASSAVDAKKAHHRGTDYVEKPSWISDAIKKQPPKYPYEQRARYIGGIGVVRLTLDLSTGSVSKAAMVRSTGVPALDSSAMEGFRPSMDPVLTLAPGERRELGCLVYPPQPRTTWTLIDCRPL
jgi:TonB family protein